MAMLMLMMLAFAIPSQAQTTYNQVGDCFLVSDSTLDNLYFGGDTVEIYSCKPFIIVGGYTSDAVSKTPISTRDIIERHDTLLTPFASAEAGNYHLLATSKRIPCEMAFEENVVHTFVFSEVTGVQPRGTQGFSILLYVVDQDSGCGDVTEGATSQENTRSVQVKQKKPPTRWTLEDWSKAVR